MNADPRPDLAGAFAVELVHLNGKAVLQLHGDLDMNSGERLREAARQFHAQGIRELALDLSTLDFIDSSGLRELVLAHKRQQEVGGDLILRSPTKQTCACSRSSEWIRSSPSPEPDDLPAGSKEPVRAERCVADHGPQRGL